MFTNSVMQLLYYEPPWLIWVLFEGPAIYLTITSVVQLSWLSAFHSKCSFLPPRDQRDVFVVCCSIHIPAPSSLPSFLRLPLMEASPSSLGHKSLMCAHTQTATTTAQMSSQRLYPALDMTLHFSSSLPLTFGALNLLLALQLVSGCLFNFKVWFGFQVKLSTFQNLMVRV